ncbi:MAG: signal peptidase I [Acidobacteria bacterium]|jgi:signal peptidase I|nr:signal peptidase I [Acidobacteriota bacterium]
MSKNATEVQQSIGAAKTLAPPKSTAREYFESFVVTLVMAIFGMTFILQAVTVPTGSMQNTILIGDYLLVNKFIFAPGGRPLPFLPQRDIVRGDIIVFKYPGFRDNPAKDRARGITPYQINYVKRVIGLPGETVEFRNNQVFINGQLIPEHRIEGDSSDEDSALETKEIEPRKPEDKYDVYYSENTMEAVLHGQNLNRNDFNFGTAGKIMQVPENSYFVMGDARDNSEDSRFWGFVNRDLIIGRAMFVYWSCDRAASDGSMLGCITNPRLNRIGKLIK